MMMRRRTVAGERVGWVNSGWIDWGRFRGVKVGGLLRAWGVLVRFHRNGLESGAPWCGRSCDLWFEFFKSRVGIWLIVGEVEIVVALGSLEFGDS
ncbi:hypothetical protein Drorol1_Dr00001019 [Drosera rotundifolia]